MAGYQGPIDLDRGVMFKKSWLAPEIGMVGMYKDDPGKYFSDNGAEVSEAIAKLAGFDVDKFARVRFLRERQAEFEREIADELRKAAGTSQVVLATHGGFSVVQLANGRADVVDVDGKRINAKPLTEAEATRLFEMLAATEGGGNE